MRLLDPRTIRVVSREMKDEDFDTSTVSRKQVVSHAWSEIMKYLATKQTHPKMFLGDVELGVYARVVYTYGISIGCNLNETLLIKYDDVWFGYVMFSDLPSCEKFLALHFEEYEGGADYLISDIVSLYLKGLNLYPYVYKENWRKYVPIESLKEIQRVVTKTIDKNKK